MVTITFGDRGTEKRALAFLIGRFSGRVLRSGEHLMPEAALEALADQNIPFTVRGKATYEQQMAAFRGAASVPGGSEWFVCSVAEGAYESAASIRWMAKRSEKPYEVVEAFELAPNGEEQACGGFHFWTDEDFNAW
jgi:hypothetical protein